MGGKLSILTEALLGMVLPKVCAQCGRALSPGESLLCVDCRMDMPLTGIAGEELSPIHDRIGYRTRVKRVAAYFHYHKGAPVTALIREAKYMGKPWIIRLLGGEYAEMLRKKGFFEGMDVILPVPMHHWKKIRRGYNQAELLALAVSKATGIPVGDNLRCVRRHATQTRRGPMERSQNVSGIFGLRHPEELHGLHILLVDDVITTGSTLRECADTILANASPESISVLTLGLAGS